MTVSCDQTLGYHEAGAGNSRSLCRLLVRESNLVNTEYVADRITILMQDLRRHGLFLLELIDLRGESANLLLHSVGI